MRRESLSSLSFKGSRPTYTLFTICYLLSIYQFITTISGIEPNRIGRMLVPIPFVIIIKLSVSFITRLANFAPYSEGTTGAPIIGKLT